MQIFVVLDFERDWHYSKKLGLRRNDNGTGQGSYDLPIPAPILVPHPWPHFHLKRGKARWVLGGE